MTRLLIVVVAAVVLAACSADDGSGVVTDDAATTSPSSSPTSQPTTTGGAPTSAPATTTTTVPGSTTVPDATSTTTDGGYRWDTLVLPPVLVAAEGLVQLVSDGAIEIVTGVDGTAARAFATSTGTVLIDEVIEASYPTVHQYLVEGDGGADWLLPDEPGPLLDLVEIGGIPHIVYVGGDLSPEAGLFMLRDLTTGVDTPLGTAYESEYGVFAASVGGRLIAVSAVADLTEIISFVSTDGAAKELPSPTDDLAYNAPPFIGPAALSPDGALLAYVEQPDTGIDSPTTPTGDTAVVITELTSGEEDLRLPLDGVDGVEAIDYDGRWVLVSAVVDDTTVPYLIDTGSPALDVIELSDLNGVASLA